MSDPAIPPIGSADFKVAAHLYLASLRAKGPIHPVRFAGGVDGWLVVGYELARQAFNHPALAMDTAPAQTVPEETGINNYEHGPSGPDGLIYTTDGKVHTRLRQAMTRRLASQQVRRRAAHIRQMADGLLAGFAQLGCADLVTDYARPLAVKATGELLGLDGPWGEQLRRLSDEALGNPSDQQRRATAEFGELVESLVAAKRNDLGDDLVSDLIAVEQQADGRLRSAEVVGTTKLLVLGGYATPAHFIAIASLALLRHPDQIPLVLHPLTTDHAIEELLRYDHPLDYSPLRFAATDLDLAGHTIAKGTPVAISIAFLGSDSDGVSTAGTDLDTLDLARPHPRHLAFGFGQHRCPGAALALIQTKIALSTLFGQLPGLVLEARETGIQWHTGGILRGPDALPVRFPPASLPAAAL